MRRFELENGCAEALVTFPLAGFNMGEAHPSSIAFAQTGAASMADAGPLVPWLYGDFIGKKPRIAPCFMHFRYISGPIDGKNGDFRESFNCKAAQLGSGSC